MKLEELFERDALQPWGEGAKLPWNDPAFSARMLREHLSQQHDRASRRIERHVDWIHRTVLHGVPGRVLDLGCGPGLYTARLASRGHDCVGIDFAPASIARARSEAERQGHPCEYRLQDLRDGDFGSGFQAVLFLSGEPNTFPPPELRSLLVGAYRALAPEGALVLEVHTDTFVRELGEESPGWFTSAHGLFSDEPHLCLPESTWHPVQRATTERYFVIDIATGEIRTHASTTQAYSSSEYASLLQESGFDRFERHPSPDASAPHREGLVVFVARRETVRTPSHPPLKGVRR